MVIPVRIIQKKKKNREYAKFTEQNATNSMQWGELFTLLDINGKETDNFALAHVIRANRNFASVGGVSAFGNADTVISVGGGGETTTTDISAQSIIDALGYTPANPAELGSMAYEDADDYALASQLSGYVLKTQLGSMAYEDADDYALSSQLSGYVTTNTEQEISAAKWFKSHLMFFESKYSFFGKNGIYIEPGSDTFIGHHTGQSGDTGFLYFKSDGTTQFVGDLMRGFYNDARTIIGAGCLELYHATPHIDFHAEMAEDDYTLRLIENETGVLEVIGNAIKIGDAYLTFDYDNNALCITGKDGKQINAYTTGGFSAFSGLPQYSTLNNLTLNNLLTVKNISLTDGFLDDISLNQHNITDCSNITTVNINAETINTANLNAQKIKFNTGNTINDISADSQYLYITVNNIKYTISLQ